jgi:putative transposase
MYRQLSRLREPEAENAKLKKMYTGLAMGNEALRDVIAKKL